MLIKQLSIFLENKKGRFTRVATLLGGSGELTCLLLPFRKTPISVSYD